jgi:S-methylmethionine-dependent homocysteine/selenocysteine methylase
MGTELRRRGYELTSPLFSSAACLEPEGVELIKQVHVDYLRAGAHTLRSNSFPLLAAVPEIGMDKACEVAATSVRLARLAISEERAPAWVAGCIGPVAEPEPGQVLSLARALLDAGADSLIVETCTTRAMVEAAFSLRNELQEELAVSLTLDARGRLLDGSSLEDWPKPDKVPDLLALNCVEILDVDAGIKALTRLAHAWGIERLGLWPSCSGTDIDGNFVQTAVDPENFANVVSTIADSRESLSVVGGCCGSTPAHILAMAAAL